MDNFDSLYNGSYNFYRHANIYSEESFKVYQDKKNPLYYFHASMHCRVTTGELLIIKMEYVIDKGFIPKEVSIKKNLGGNKVDEHFTCNREKKILHYRFDNGKDVKEIEIPTPQIFHISTPFACTSMLFLRSKKFVRTAKNKYYLISSNNLWEYKKSLEMKAIILETDTLISKKIELNGNKIQALQYHLSEADESEKESHLETKDKAFVYMGQHIIMPYVIEEPKRNIKIKVNSLETCEKYLF